MRSRDPITSKLTSLMGLVPWALRSWEIGKTCPKGQFVELEGRLAGTCSAVRFSRLMTSAPICPPTDLGERGSDFQNSGGDATVSVLSGGIIYGDSPIALFRRGGGRGKFLPRCREGACGAAFTQPADSKAKAEIGQPLFDRLPRSVVLTEAGRCFLDYARQILASIGDARRCVDELKDAVTGKLAVGSIPTIAPYVLPELVKKFDQDDPEAPLE